MSNFKFTLDNHSDYQQPLTKNHTMNGIIEMPQFISNTVNEDNSTTQFNSFDGKYETNTELDDSNSIRAGLLRNDLNHIQLQFDALCKSADLEKCNDTDEKYNYHTNSVWMKDKMDKVNSTFTHLAGKPNSENLVGKSNN